MFCLSYFHMHLCFILIKITFKILHIVIITALHINVLLAVRYAPYSEKNTHHVSMHGMSSEK